ncbi:hypothetical protein KPL26_13380 [Clostridium algidicarnis]|uniref:hypothetical protein n=1 Tax=Clostridium algidicarnis TaxID=37659 RepID=UPI001C0DFDBA|nr:hypothetical protein [Clostridium algidicarnis]MBU3197630.1 hypothetical protein [Clostridium algidicarnis]
MNKKCEKINILDKRKVISIVITSVLMIPFISYQYYHFGNTLKYRLDNLQVYKWIASRPFALTNEGYIPMHSSPRFGVLGNLQDLITVAIFILLILLVYFLISKSLYFYFKKKELINSKEI